MKWLLSGVCNTAGQVARLKPRSSSPDVTQAQEKAQSGGGSGVGGSLGAFTHVRAGSHVTVSPALTEKAMETPRPESASPGHLPGFLPHPFSSAHSSPWHMSLLTTVSIYTCPPPVLRPLHSTLHFLLAIPLTVCRHITEISYFYAVACLPSRREAL